MKIVVFGANGRTGAQFVEQALAQGHQVTAYVRRAESLIIRHPNLQVLEGNLKETLVMKEAIAGADACISTLGGNSLTKHSPKIMRGIGRIVNLMEQEGVSRFIYLSSLGAGESRYFMTRLMRFLLGDILLRVPLADHSANEALIAQSNLHWTVVRPGGLTNGPKTGVLHHGCEATLLKGSVSVSRSNVAAFMLEQLTNEQYIKKCVWLYQGK